MVGSLYVGAREATFLGLVHTFNQRVALIAAVCILLAGVIAIPIGHVITQPITELVEAHRRLSAGEGDGDGALHRVRHRQNAPGADWGPERGREGDNLHHHAAHALDGGGGAAHRVAGRSDWVNVPGTSEVPGRSRR